MHGAVDGLRLVDTCIVRHGRRGLVLLLRHVLGRKARLRVMLHVRLRIILVVLLRHTIWLRRVGIGRIGVWRHVRMVHVLRGVGRVLLLREPLLLLICCLLWVITLMPGTMSGWLDRRGRRHGSWASVGTRCAGHVEVGLTGVARSTLHGWLPSRQAVGHLAGLGGDGSQCRSLLAKSRDDEPCPKVLRRDRWNAPREDVWARVGTYCFVLRDRKAKAVVWSKRGARGEGKD